MDYRVVKSRVQSFLTAIGPLILISFLIVGTSLSLGLMPRLVTRFCYNSPNPSQVNSQCVLCNYYLFDSTLLGCTGSSALNFNITSAQAFCVISQCLGQIRQSPVFLGRKKRSSDEIEVALEDDNTGHNLIGDNELKDQEIDFDESSQPVYKYNSNEHFIVAKEVEALIIDLPEVIDDAVFSV